MSKAHILIVSLCFFTTACATFDRSAEGSLEEDVASEATSKADSGDPVRTVALRLRAPASAPVRATGQLVSAVRDHDLTLGMNMEEVITSWGEPRDVQTAGLPGQGFERWVYYEGLSSPWSLSSYRVIYFDQGRVSGWETVRSD